MLIKSACQAMLIQVLLIDAKTESALAAVQKHCVLKEPASACTYAHEPTVYSHLTVTDSQPRCLHTSIVQDRTRQKAEISSTATGIGEQAAAFLMLCTAQAPG